MDKIIRWIGPSVQRTIFGDRLDYLAMDSIIMIVRIQFPTIMITATYQMPFLCFRNSFPFMPEVLYL